MEKDQITSTGQNFIGITKRKAEDGTEINIEYITSDLVFQQFSSTEGKIRKVSIREMCLYQKQLDKPLPWYKKVGATVLGVNTKHEFLLFKTEFFELTIDFYKGSIIKIRIGGKEDVLTNTVSKMRGSAQVVKEKDGLEWQKQIKEGTLTIQDVFKYLNEKPFISGHSQVSYNGRHFSREMWVHLAALIKERKSGQQ